MSLLEGECLVDIRDKPYLACSRRERKGGAGECAYDVDRDDCTRYIADLPTRQVARFVVLVDGSVHAPDTNGPSRDLQSLFVSSRNYDRIATRYEDLRGGDARAEAIASAIAPEVFGDRILDVGVGTGIVGAVFERRGFTVFGVDISRSMLAKARPRLAGRVACATGERMPLRGRTIDTALFVWSLHHIADPVAAVREAARVVRAEGRVIAVSARPEPPTDEIGRTFMRLNELAGPDAADAPDLPTQAGLRTVAAGAIPHPRHHPPPPPIELSRGTECLCHSRQEVGRGGHAVGDVRVQPEVGDARVDELGYRCHRAGEVDSTVLVVGDR